MNETKCPKCGGELFAVKTNIIKMYQDGGKEVVSDTSIFAECPECGNVVFDTDIVNSVRTHYEMNHN